MPELIVSPNGRRYGYLKNTIDQRDFGLMHPDCPIERIVRMPVRTNNKPFIGVHRDQGSEGSCTGHAESAANNFLYNMLGQFTDLKLTAQPNFSPACAYWFGRKIDGSLAEGDCGSTGRSVANGSRVFGICQESDWPYVAGQFSIAPTDTQVAAALKFKSGAFHAVMTLQDFKSCLASQPYGYGVMLGFNVYESFEDKIGADGLMPTPDFNKEDLLGKHEVFGYDYDDEKQMGDGTTGGVVFQNSWGASWGNNGDFWMSYQQLANPKIFVDATLQHLGKPWAKAA